MSDDTDLYSDGYFPTQFSASHHLNRFLWKEHFSLMHNVYNCETISTISRFYVANLRFYKAFRSIIWIYQIPIFYVINLGSRGKDNLRTKKKKLATKKKINTWVQKCNSEKPSWLREKFITPSLHKIRTDETICQSTRQNGRYFK